jgi:hypothetical protein
MTFHIWREFNVVPVTRKLNVRTVLGDGGPHLMTFGCRTTQIAGGTFGANLQMGVRYELPNGEIRTVDNVAGISLDDLDQLSGGIWYHDSFMTIDTYHPLADGPYPENPLGVFTIDFTLGGNPSGGNPLYTYEAVIQTFDGSPAVVFHP